MRRIDHPLDYPWALAVTLGVCVLLFLCFRSIWRQKRESRGHASEYDLLFASTQELIALVGDIARGKHPRV